MSRQITIRLADELIEFVNQSAERAQTSKDEIIARAVESLRRHELAERDAAILSSSAGDTEFDELAEFAAGGFTAR